MGSLEGINSESKDHSQTGKKHSWVIPGGKLRVEEEIFGKKRIVPPAVKLEDFAPPAEERRKNEKIIWEVD